MITLAVWIQSTNVSDGQTDGHTDTGRQQRPRLRRASRGNKIASWMDFGTRYARLLSDPDLIPDPAIHRPRWLRYVLICSLAIQCDTLISKQAFAILTLISSTVKSK